MLIACTAFAQITRMTGVVLSAEDDEPILGATVRVTGSKNTTATDINGKFTLTNLKPTDRTITVTFVGMEPQTVKIAPEVTIKLKTSSKVMDEVVVVAFGKQKREAFTGSAGVLKGENLTLQQANDPISALEGKVSGVSIVSGNDPTAEPEITIRGITSLNAGSSPLIVVDGLPYNGYYSDINPADVENITVLKDAASNALYGARGANGVIMITTKSASRGNTAVTFDMKWGANTDGLIDYDKIDNPGQYYETHYLALRNYYTRAQGMDFNTAHSLANKNLSASSDLGGLEYMVYSVPQNQYLIGTNGRLNPNAMLGNRVAYEGQIYTLTPDSWRDHGIRDGFRQEYNVNINGGSDKFAFYASLGYLDNEGLTYNSDLKRYTARVKTEYQAYPWMRVGVNADYSHSKANKNSNAFSIGHDIAPIYPLFIRDGAGNILTDQHGPRYDYGDGGNGGMHRTIEQSANSIQEDQLDVHKTINNAFNMQGFININFLRDFRLTLNGTVHFSDLRMVDGYNPYYGFNTEANGTLTDRRWNGYDTNLQQLLDWTRDFGQHHVSVLLGHEYNRSKVHDLSATKNNFAMWDQNKELNGAIINGSISGYTSIYNVEGYFARAQYDFDNRYFLSGSFRRDGSSRFHPKHRWGNFWSLGGAWIMTKEEWFPKTPAVNMLKLKLSYGQQGNDQIGDFLYTDLYTITNSNDQIGISFSQKGNPNITWETVGNLNTGIEFELFNSRLDGSVEYYHRKTTDMLNTFYVPTSLGYGAYYDNIGDMLNQGVEINLDATLLQFKNVTWQVNANMSFENNKITYLPDENKTASLDGHPGYNYGNYFYGEGMPLYTWRMPQYAGVNDEGRAVYYVDQTDSEGNVTRGTTTDASSATYYNCGSALPDFYGGFGTTLRAFGFDLTANFNFSVGGKKYDWGYAKLMKNPVAGSTGFSMHADVLNSWSEDNTGSDIPRWQYGDVAPNVSSRFLTDASNLTFKTLNIGYTLPANITRKMAMKRLRVYFACDNLYFWSKRKGFDPRSSRTQSNAGGYSPMRTFMGGINVQF